MRSVQKTSVKVFRLSFPTGSASRNSQSKKVESKKPFFDCVIKLDLGFSRKRPFSTDKSGCIRNGLRIQSERAVLDGLNPTVLELAFCFDACPRVFFMGFFLIFVSLQTWSYLVLLLYFQTRWVP